MSSSITTDHCGEILDSGCAPRQIVEYYSDCDPQQMGLFPFVFLLDAAVVVVVAGGGVADYDLIKVPTDVPKAIYSVLLQWGDQVAVDVSSHQQKSPWKNGTELQAHAELAENTTSHILKCSVVSN